MSEPTLTGKYLWQGGEGSLTPSPVTVVGPLPDSDEHVVLVAVMVTGCESREQAEQIINGTISVGKQETDDPSWIVGSPAIEAWWIAEDDRHDGSDNDSAVFVRKGNQVRGFIALNERGLTPAHNDPRRQR